VNDHVVSDVRQMQIHTADLQVPKPRSFEVDSAIANLKRYKLPRIDQILAE
jgi:hypothetical protein